MNGFWWSDFSAAAIILLSGTGVVLWAIPLLKTRSKKKKQVGNAPAAASQGTVPPRRPATVTVGSFAPPEFREVSGTYHGLPVAHRLWPVTSTGDRWLLVTTAGSLPTSRIGSWIALGLAVALGILLAKQTADE